jgi:hypothetical protein
MPTWMSSAPLPSPAEEEGATGARQEDAVGQGTTRPLVEPAVPKPGSEAAPKTFEAGGGVEGAIGATGDAHGLDEAITRRTGGHASTKPAPRGAVTSAEDRGIHADPVEHDGASVAGPSAPMPGLHEGGTAGASGSTTIAEPGVPSPARRLLDAASHELAEGHVEVARARLAEAQALAPSARELARADLLRADALRIEHHYPEAIAAYRQIAEQDGATTQHEQAAFWLAQLLAERGSRSEALAACARYLERYPAGRFRAEVAARRSELLQSPPPTGSPTPSR